MSDGAVDESAARSIALGDDDWLWATWRSRKNAVQIPAEIPFDRDAVLERIAAKVKPARHGWSYDFSRAALSPSMSKDEARLWFECMHSIEKNSSPKARADALEKKKLAPLTLEGAMKTLEKNQQARAPEIPLVLSVIFGAFALTESFLAHKPSSDGWIAGGSFFDGWHRHVFPRLTDDERKTLLARVRPAITPANFPTDYYEEPSSEFLVGASLGAHDELLAVVSSWPNDRFADEDWYDAYHVPQLMIFGLGSQELVQEHMRRLDLRLRFDVYMRAWLAHTEYAGLDFAARTVCTTKNKDTAAELAKVLALVHAPENAVAMLEVHTRSKAATVGAEWLDRNVGCAAAGLVEVAAGRGALAESATERLRILKRAGYTQLIEKAAGSAAPEAAQKASALLAAKEKVLAPLVPAPKWLEAPMKTVKRARRAAWVEHARLPALEVDDKTLSPEQLGLFLDALAESMDTCIRSSPRCASAQRSRRARTSRGSSSKSGSRRARLRKTSGRSSRWVISAATRARCVSRRSFARGPANRNINAPSSGSTCSRTSEPTSRSCNSRASPRR